MIFPTHYCLLLYYERDAGIAKISFLIIETFSIYFFYEQNNKIHYKQYLLVVYDFIIELESILHGNVAICRTLEEFL